MPQTEGAKRNQRFTELLNNWPQTGDVIRALAGPATVNIQTNGHKTKVWTTAIIDPDCTGWFLQLDERGVKVMIHPKDHKWVTELPKPPRIWQVRVMRETVQKTALICEVVKE